LSTGLTEVKKAEHMDKIKRALPVILFFSLTVFLTCSAAGAEGKSYVVRDRESNRLLSPLSAGYGLYLQADGGYSVSSGYFAATGADDMFRMPGEFEEKKEGMKSTTKAALFSLVLPGAGEIYGGSKTKGEIFIFSEASVWAGFFAFRTYGHWLEDDYKSYAASHARVDLTGKPGDFFDNLSFYDSRDMYNQFAPLYHPGEAHPYPEDDQWNWVWDSRDSRLYYRELKNRSKDASRRALYLVGLSLVNRIVSVLDAVKTVRSYNHAKSFELSRIKFDWKANPFGRNPRIMLYVSQRW
jgi:hypothetical protein